MKRDVRQWLLLAVGHVALMTAGCQTQPVTATLATEPVPIVLTASTAKIVGPNARLDKTPEAEYIGYWTNTGTFVEWPLKHVTPGTYRVQILYALAPQSALSTIELTEAGQTLNALLASTNNWHDYRALNLGTIKIAQPGDAMLIIKATNKPGTYVMNLQSVILTPAAPATAPSPAK